jgi:hypothetical protein
MRNNIVKVSKDHWYSIGGFKNSACFRKADKNGSWNYYVDLSW